ncbi:MAG TPA: peptidylprolyl isomerase [Actinophytocola sp.]|uniref:peptidylprolyl isomerase n=1 Tax=Actinophytocola sp. TaxID=1872138 RepID=UPI002DDCAAA4|nr:peptidylprolyl isomerase [Actinophytocola sp.]HEV2779677.1 peptidylprolyl isomerase [Actinophytocola sp.]
MPTNEQRRQAAKRKLERQLARRAERAKRRRIIGVVVTVVAVVAAVGIVYWLANIGDGDSTAAAQNTTTETTPPAKTSEGPCQYTETPAEPSPKPAGLPADPSPTPNTGTLAVTLKTSQGDMPLVLDRAKAPCTVQSIEHLVKAMFFDNTKCHRLTASEGLKVLQCGDPTGSGSGGPGYTIKDEFPTDLKPTGGQDGQGQPLVTYPRGTLAMANTGAPNSGSSQFFIVYGDTTLPAKYTVFGTIDAAGLAVADKIAAGGITPGRDANDGAPKLDVTITQAVITG